MKTERDGRNSMDERTAKAATAKEQGPATRRRSERASLYVWTAIVLAVALAVVVLGWHAQGGTPDPTSLPSSDRLSHTTVVVDSSILVFREGLETILVLAAVLASFLGANRAYRRPVAAGGAAALGAGVLTWLAAVWLLGSLGGSGLTLQAATGLPALVVLLIVMNWFFHKVYWTGWISSHHRRRKSLLSGDGDAGGRRLLLGFAILGFTSVYRECFEVVIFLQNLRLLYGSSVVLEGVTIGLLFTAAVGVLTFGLHQRLPYRKLLILTGAMLLFVLLVSTGEEVNEMQLAGWIGTTPIGWLHLPGWMGTWFSLFPNWETFIGQAIALTLVLGSYLAAQYLRVWRPRRRGGVAARRPDAPPITRDAAPAPAAARASSARASSASAT